MSCRARSEHAKIQSRDLLFKENNRNRFKSSTECRGLKIGSDICTDSQVIADHFCDHFAKLAVSSASSPLRNAASDVSRIEVTSFLSYDNILDYEILVEEIEGALKTIKLGKSEGVDCLDPEYIYFGGDALKLWLKKTFNRIVSLEKVPDSLNEGLIIPVHKGKGKDPFLPGNYRGITLSFFCHQQALRNYPTTTSNSCSRRSRCSRLRSNCISERPILCRCHLRHTGSIAHPCS